ncbi:hypothetical protein TRVA0_038S00452 [Trichomonascus vanleenenianus]|uniref:uncharacterized protein n=1 Tax=Trichomonascus vanleenenianus TaxID=2268995 RepID=UPI003ECB5A5E
MSGLFEARIPRFEPIEHRASQEFITTSPSRSGVNTPTMGHRLTRGFRRRHRSPIMISSQTPSPEIDNAKKAIGSNSSNTSSLTPREQLVRILRNGVKGPARKDSIKRHQSLMRRNTSIRRVPLRRNPTKLLKKNPSLRNGGQYSALPHVPLDSTKRPDKEHDYPVMMIRRRSSTNSIRGSPIRRFFVWLFRLRRKKQRAKYNFSKHELERQLSFEVRESPNRVAKYEIKSMELLNLRPQVRRVPTMRRKQSSRSSTQTRKLTPEIPEERDDTFEGFDHDYTANMSNRKLRRGLTTSSSNTSATTTTTTTNLSTITASSTGSSELSRQFTRKRSIVHRNGTFRRDLPVIRRVDLYDNPDPVVQLDAEPILSDKGEGNKDIDEALAFVETWSTYLRRAIAIRVILRRQILEQRKGMYAADNADDSSVFSVSSVSSDSSSVYSDSSSARGSSRVSNRSSYSSTGSAKSSRTATPNLRGDSGDEGSSVANGKSRSNGGYYPSSDTYSLSQYTYSSTTASRQSSQASNRSSLYGMSRSPPVPRNVDRERVNAIRESLEQGGIYQKYSSLVTPPATHEHSEQSQSPSSYRPVYKGRENLWIHQKRIPSRPLPTPPTMAPPAREEDENEHEKSGEDTRNKSKQILTRMYSELAQLQDKSRELNNIFNAQESQPRENYHQSNSGTALQRGGKNRRRISPSKDVLMKRMSLGSIISEESVRPRGHWRHFSASTITTSDSPNPMLVEVGASRPPSMSEARFI